MERKADPRKSVKPLPTVDDLRRADIEIANDPAATNPKRLHTLTGRDENTVLEPPFTLEDLRREAIKIANDPVATVRERLQALITYEKLSGFDKPQKIDDAVASDPLADIQG
jgi:hypothetical protein